MMEEKQGESKQFKSAYDVYEAKRKGLLQEICLRTESGHKGKKPDADQASQQIQELDKNNQNHQFCQYYYWKTLRRKRWWNNLPMAGLRRHFIVMRLQLLSALMAFNPERCLRYFGFINRMWDGNSYKRQRITTEDCYIYGKRLTCSLMMQISVLKSLINVPMDKAAIPDSLRASCSPA